MENVQNEQEPQLLTVEEVARILRLSTGAVRSLIGKKEIPAIRLGKQFRIPRYAIDNLLSPFFGKTPEELGFGALKGRFGKMDSVEYVNRLRKKDESKSLEQIFKELREWEKTSSLTRTS